VLYQFPKVLIEKVSDLASNATASRATSIVPSWFYISLPIILIRKLIVIIVTRNRINFQISAWTSLATIYRCRTIPFSKSFAILISSKIFLWNIWRHMWLLREFAYLVHAALLSQQNFIVERTPGNPNKCNDS